MHTRNLPVVLRNIAAVFHGPPRSPGHNRVDSRVPDALAPDDVLDVKCDPVVHGPLGKHLSRDGWDLSPADLCQIRSYNDGEGRTYTTPIRAHKVNRLATAVIRRSRARTGSGAEDLPDPSRPGRDERTGAVYGNGLASANGRDGRGAVATEASRARAAALHLRWAGALVRHSCAGAVRGPATVAAGPVGARRLRAALDGGRIGRARAVDGGSASGRAVCGGDADAFGEDISAHYGNEAREAGSNTGHTAGAVAGLVDGGERRRGGQDGEDEGSQVHLDGLGAMRWKVAE